MRISDWSSDVCSSDLNYDDVGYAAVGAAASGTISATSPALPAGAFAEVTALDSGKTILVAIAGNAPDATGYLLTLSPEAARLLGVSGDRVAVRVRQDRKSTRLNSSH